MSTIIDDPTSPPSWVTNSSMAWGSDQTPGETYAAAWLRIFGEAPPDDSTALNSWDPGQGIYRRFADGKIGIRFPSGATGISVEQTE